MANLIIKVKLSLIFFLLFNMHTNFHFLPKEPKFIENRLEEQLNCAICLHTFVDPRMLPCSHSFCKKCITDLAALNNHTHVNCPKCRGKFSVPYDGFKVDFNAASFLDVLAESKTGRNPAFFVSFEKFLFI